jgi:hypothetical protein
MSPLSPLLYLCQTALRYRNVPFVGVRYRNVPFVGAASAAASSGATTTTAGSATSAAASAAWSAGAAGSSVSRVGDPAVALARTPVKRKDATDVLAGVPESKAIRSV